VALAVQKHVRHQFAPRLFAKMRRKPGKIERDDLIPIVM
jgi:hypothetical protein